MFISFKALSTLFTAIFPFHLQPTRKDPEMCGRCHSRESLSQFRTRADRFQTTVPANRGAGVGWGASDGREDPDLLAERVTHGFSRFMP